MAKITFGTRVWDEFTGPLSETAKVVQCSDGPFPRSSSLLNKNKT